MHRFPYFILLVVSFAFVPLFFAMVLFIQFKSGGFSQHTKTASLHLKFCVVGALNALNGMCVIFANPHVPGSLQQIMVQAVMPITMGMSIVILGSKFHRLQLLGALMICMGVIIELYPLFIGSKGPGGGLEISPGAVDDAQMHSHELLTSGTQTSTYPYAYRYTSGSAIVSTGAKNNAQQSQPPAYFWSMVFLLGQVPMGMQSVFQELAFSQAHVNVVYMMAWSSLAQFLSLCVLSVFNFIPKFGAVAPGDFGEYMKESLQCARGYGDGCEQAPVLLTCFVMIMLTAQIVQALLVKKSSAALVVIVLTVITPLSTVCFSIPYLMGEHTEALKISTCVALVVLTVGVIIYRVPDALVLKEGRKCEADESSFTDSDGLHTQRRETEPLLTRKKSRTATTDSDRHPVMLNSRIGVISSEYTGEADISDGIKTILYSHTHLTEGDANAHPTHTHAHTHTMSHSYSNVDA
ncbi:hypothetical protein SARC_09199 [Sphaeroforma arctica JP610]|uniref:EamA domain-containing protein n=1 Tax=Sphaeroforma arctica JP610 TaxID=667725 RepID=A0A0L0FNH7_9EUKA|nr:hypothetical protein SARC_09199 [Sphaeroforma arctica JP610]KNC78365.1 hypothetical protein SARC_09199 [Sphaeroforma arctica JP610]|eukprot:XP_014152267.1 hypothetical protein SARC_09199 [Sphaeroforma arctica JP610]